MGDRTYSAAELEAAIAAIESPQRLRRAQDTVASAVPALQRVLGQALFDGGWFDSALDQAVRGAVGGEDAAERLRAVQTLIAEETRLGMLVGVAVGFELAEELRRRDASTVPRDSTAGGAGSVAPLDTPTPPTQE